jgi:hypothetical protein
LTALIRIYYADGRVEERRLLPGRYLIGREMGDIVLSDPNVSGRHAELDVQPGPVVITDVGSTNGTWDAGGARIYAPLLLQTNRPVSLGRSRIELVASARTTGTRVATSNASESETAHAPNAAAYAPLPTPLFPGSGGAAAMSPGWHATAQEGRQMADAARLGMSKVIARTGKAAPVALAFVWVAFFCLPALTISFFLVSRSVTFWDMLAVNPSNPGLDLGTHGPFGFLAVVALCAPLAAPFVQTARARLLYLAPLVFSMLAGARYWWGLTHLALDTGPSFPVPGLGASDPRVTALIDQFTATAKQVLMSSVSAGYGLFVLFAAALVLAVLAFVRPPQPAP